MSRKVNGAANAASWEITALSVLTKTAQDWRIKLETRMIDLATVATMNPGPYPFYVECDTLRARGLGEKPHRVAAKWGDLDTQDFAYSLARKHLNYLLRGAEFDSEQGRAVDPTTIRIVQLSPAESDALATLRGSPLLTPGRSPRPSSR